MTDKSLLSRLSEYDRVAMHMPGHKRRKDLLCSGLPYHLDITEVSGFDNLHDMRGILKETAEMAAELYGSKYAFPLINGSTCGILAAIMAFCPFGSHALLARNCHKSVYNAISLFGITPHYLTPETDKLGVCGKISPKAVKNALENNSEISMVVIASPTYEGVASDIPSIAYECKKRGVYLLIDSAHGAHLGFSSAFPDSAVSSGADAVVMSLHKTMPSLTQTAVLHVMTNKIEKSKFEEALSVFETSSPSYVLLASIDECLRMINKNKDSLFGKYIQNLKDFYKNTKKLKALSVTHYDDFGKIIISTENTNLSGSELSGLLRDKYKIETEMSAEAFCLAITSICDTEDNFNRLSDALFHIDNTLTTLNSTTIYTPSALPEIKDIPFAVRNADGEFENLKNAEGCECLEFIWAYPPGIPLIVPGEIISRDLIEKIYNMKKSGIEIKSTKGFKDNKIYIKKRV